MAVTEKKWTKDEIKNMLTNSDKAVMRGIVSIYSLQTREEQSMEQTRDVNGVGFSGVDGEFLSSLAKQILDRGSLSSKQMEHGRKKILKYAGQLTKIANGELSVKEV